MRREGKSSSELSTLILHDPGETEHMLNLINKLEALEAKWELLEALEYN